MLFEKFDEIVLLFPSDATAHYKKHDDDAIVRLMKISSYPSLIKDGNFASLKKMFGDPTTI